MTRILAASSGGGHWQQLQLIAAAFDGAEVVFACSGGFTGDEVRSLPDCNLRTPWRVLKGLWSAFALVRAVQPDIVVSTGAAPGLLVLICAKCLGARTVWIDSVANAERLSLSGRLASPFSDLWLTQWPHVAEQSGASYAGAVL